MTDLFKDGNLVTTLDERFGLEITEGARRELNYTERRMADALGEIKRRVDALLAALDDPDGVWDAVAEIANGAGASGPIGSMWERALAAATEARTIGRFATTYSEPVTEGGK
jgi:hypothetical protein